MHLAGRDRDPSTNGVEGSTEEGPALRDAATIAARAADDEEAAATARDRFRSIPIPAIEADDAIRPHLDPDERVHSLRRRAILSILVAMARWVTEERCTSPRAAWSTSDKGW